MTQRAKTAIRVKAILATIVVGISTSAWAEAGRLTIDPFASSSGYTERPDVLLNVPSSADRSILYLDAQTLPAGNAGSSQTLPPVEVSGENKANPGNLHLLPDTRELEAAPYRRTLFTGLVNPKSVYGKAWFPENLRNPEMDLEFSEGQIRWYHQEKKNHYKDEFTVVYEHAFDSLTLEIEVPYQNEVEREDADAETERMEGIPKVELGMRYPFFQILSDDGNFDYTFVGAMEGAISTNRFFNKDSEVSPRVYQLIRLGDHVSIQTNLGIEALIGPDRGGTVNLIFGASLGYVVYPDQIKIPLVTQFAPILEVVGEHVLTGEKEGGFSTALFGTAGMRFNLESIMGGFQPRVGVGWVFPLSAGGREEMRYGIITSIIFEF